MTARVAGAVMGRPTNTVLSDRLERARIRNDILAEELAAAQVERRRLATELAALSRQSALAARAERLDVAMHVAGRLSVLAATLERRGAA